MSHVEELVQNIPSELHTILCEKLTPHHYEQLSKYLLSPTPHLSHLNKLFACSQYAYQQCLHAPHYLLELFTKLDITRAFRREEYSRLFLFDAHAKTIEEVDQALRQLRNKIMLRILWRDLNRCASLTETTQEMSWLAELSLQYAMDFHYAILTEDFGYPENDTGQEQPFIAIGMGKLGAHELNVSSDIDLIFCYPEQGLTNGEKALENPEFFNKLAKRVIHSLDNRNADGFVFRVDMRLRPYGQSGTLVPHFAALEDYYQTQGREWERYAMVKARIVASTQTGITQTGHYNDELMHMLRQFTYRKYIDFSVIDALRKLKTSIRQEVRRKQLSDNIKLGSGGIREIEFIAQAFQLIRGGRDTELQDNRVQRILPKLEQRQCLPVGTAQKLLDAYTFLRNTEHAIQAWQDTQTQQLPNDEAAKTALCKAMNMNSWDTFITQLNTYREIVSCEFEAIIAEQDNTEQVSKETSEGNELWLQCCQDDSCDVEKQAYAELYDFVHSYNVVQLSSTGRKRLDIFMPRLLDVILTRDTPTLLLKRLLPLVRAILRRSAYMLLLVENPGALKQLVTLVQTSPLIADELTKYPALLDELLDRETLLTPPEKKHLNNELQRVMLRIDDEDLEQQMESLRYFKLSHSLRVIACEISGALPLMKVSDYLTWIAEVVVDYTLRLVWKMMTRRHGYPDGKQRDVPDFIIVGYGKSGGIEMNHGSDLDLVFIHNASANGVTNGSKPIDNQTFYMRLGQKIIHILNTHMASGRLYEVDMRLRPSGNSGMLTSRLAAFERYQKDEAWTWEHQALVRARVLAGSDKIATAFNTLRQNILQQQRDLKALQQDIVSMRQKMRDHLGSNTSDTGVFDIKHDTGGIVDIEFMVQYLVLAWSHAHPALVAYTDNIRILEAIAHTNILSANDVAQLIAAYKALRTLLHRLTIEQKSNSIRDEQLRDERDNVIAIWHQLFDTEH